MQGSVVPSHGSQLVVKERMLSWASLKSHQTHHRSYRGRIKWPNQQCQSTEGSLFLKTRLQSHLVHPTVLTIIQQLCSVKQKHTKYKQIYTQWNGPSVTKPSPQNCKNCSHLCAYPCAQLSYTIQHGAVLIIFPLNLQTSITAQILSTGGEGAMQKSNDNTHTCSILSDTKAVVAADGKRTCHPRRDGVRRSHLHCHLTILSEHKY